MYIQEMLEALTHLRQPNSAASNLAVRLTVCLLMNQVSLFYLGRCRCRRFSNFIPSLAIPDKFLFSLIFNIRCVSESLLDYEGAAA